MNIKINGEEVPVTAGMTVAALLAERKVNSAAVVVEYNRTILERGAWESTTVGENDCLEIVSFVGGG
ncbi:MAG: sulfur carrier protein ThiS [Candidatus Omnitrophica bacterium]|nr:sulfur carrier protein ThiS [Candidatus Omnitrophota bacterium]